MRRGVRIGVDVGTVRVGVARSDPDGVLAVPVVTLRRGAGDQDELASLVAEYEALEVIVGLPRSLDGVERAAAASARRYAAELAPRVAPVPVRLMDERLSTSQAQRDLRDAGRTTRSGRSVIDQAAAVIIVQTSIDSERATGQPPGTSVGNP